MTSLHSTSFFNGRITTVGTTTLYTVPVGKRIVIKHIAMQNALGVSRQYLIVVDGVWLIYAPVLAAVGAAGSNGQLETWIPLNAGQVIRFTVGTSSSCDLSVGGYLYFV